MRYSVAALLALASSVLAQVDGFDVISKPGEGEKVPAGKTYEIVWAPDAKYGDKPVDIVLIGGPTQPKQVVIDTIASDVPSSAGTYTWEVDDSLGDQKVYGIQIVLKEDTKVFQYSFPFAITPEDGHNGGHSSSAPGSSAASSTASSSSTKTESYSSGYSTASISESTTLSSVYSSSTPSSSITPGSSSTPTKTTGTTATTGTTTATTTAATGAATAFAANGLAVLGGLAMAALAL